MSVREKILGAEARWVMGRVMAGDFLDGVDKYLHLVAPEREKELSAAIRARAGELAEADKDMIVDQPSEGALGIGAAVLASFETLLPLFDGDERRTILYLQHVMGEVLTRLVTTVMCAWDTNWMRAIDPAVSGLRAERTSLLSLGDDQCRFAVLETDDPLAGYTDKIEQRFAAQQEPG
jgi:hypothetical protein